MNEFSRTVVIPCAGAGDRLGLGITKALVKIDGKPLIIRHLEQLKNEEDIRIVVGYQAEKVINVVRAYRDDIKFVYNNDYKNTLTGTSVMLASKNARKFVLAMDGDILIHPEDIKKILSCHSEFVGGTSIESDDPWRVETYIENGKLKASAFSKKSGDYEWNGITQILSSKIENGEGHVFQLIEPYLPLEFMEIRTKEIDTINDYERAKLWVQNNFKET